MQQNFVDRAIAVFSPGATVDRMRSRAQLHALDQFSAAIDDGGQSERGSDSRRWGPLRSRDARTDTMYGLTTDRAKSRNLARSSTIGAGAINTNVDRVVGTGIALSCQPNAAILKWSPEKTAAWKLKTQAEFSLWADGTMCDIERSKNFYQIQELVLRSTLESGDTFTLLPSGPTTRMEPYPLRLQVLEADRIGNPQGAADSENISGGVRFDANGAPISYHVYDRHPGAGYAPGNLYAGTWTERAGATGRSHILHHFRQLRPGQPRGLPYLAPVVDAIKSIARYSEAEITAAVVSAYFTVFIETESGNAAPVFAGAEAPGAAPGDDLGLGPGAVVGLAKGEKATFANPGRPSTAFEPFTLAVTRQIGMALGIPYELLIKQFNASYSASKAALLDAWVYFRSSRTWLTRSLNQPVYEIWLADAVALGRIEAPGFFADPMMRWAYTRTTWNGDSMGSINPKDEIAAYTAAIEAGLMTHERAEWELFGTDFSETFDQKAGERKRLEAANLLPPPKAGAAAPAQPNPAPAPPAKQGT